MSHLLWIATAALFVSADAHAAVLTVDCAAGPFLTISSAVSSAANGDTIVVHPCSSPYNENVMINSFDDLHLIGADAPSVVGATQVGVGMLWSPPVVISGTGLPGSCISIIGSGSVSVTGFTVRQCRVGVHVIQSRDTVVTNVRGQANTFAGYYESGATNSRVAGNLFSGSQHGIFMDFNQGSTFTDNRIGMNSVTGITVGGNRIQVVGNEVLFSGQDGVRVVNGSEGRIERNRIVGNLTSGSGTANLFLDVTTSSNDVIGNDTAGSLVDLAASDLAENL